MGQPVTARARLAVVSSNRRLVTAEQLDAMSPNERAAALAEHIVMDLDDLPEGLRDRVVATGKRLATEGTRRQLGDRASRICPPGGPPDDNL